MLEVVKPRALDVYFKVNTGMNRLGFPAGKARAALERLRTSGVAKTITLMTHFAVSELPDGVDEAMKALEGVAQSTDYPRSLANSAAIFAIRRPTGTWRALVFRSTAPLRSTTALPVTWA
jgi:alanine racemase